jgi:anti-anti-sigma factor
MEPDAAPASAGERSSPGVDVEHNPLDEPRFVAVVYLRGEHDLATAPAVSDAIRIISGSILIDLSDRDFIDSTIIGTLFDHARDIRKHGNALEIVAPAAANVARTLDLVHMHELIPIHRGRPTPLVVPQPSDA